jgi:hypothetical protein
LTTLVESSDQTAVQLGSTPSLNPVGTVTIDNDEEWFGWRFTGVAVGNAASITSASFDPDATEVDSDVSMYVISEDNCAAFTTAINNVKNRTTYAAFVDETAASASANDCTTDIQTLVNRAGWASGNAIGISAVAFDPGGDDFSVDGTGGVLTIEFTGGGGGGTTGGGAGAGNMLVNAIRVGTKIKI